LARRAAPDGGLGLAGALANAAIKAAPSSRCELPYQAGCAGGGEQRPVPVPEDRGLLSFTLRVNEPA